VPGYVLRTDGGGVQVVADVFDRDADWLRPGVLATLQTDALPGRDWQGKVTQVQSDIDVGARSWRVTVRLPAADTALKANMTVDVTLHARASGPAVLSVPREAVIHTGQRSVVVRALDGGRFQPVEVSVGREFGDWIEITRGLAPGERVVVSGQFLLDSEANLRAAFERLAAPSSESAPAAPATPHQH
jgi:Cu(I)/Ag(I) efflux system membrane fusion protein